MKINIEYLKKIVAVMERMEEVDSVSGDLYIVSDIILRDGEEEGNQELHLEYCGDLGNWVFNTDKSKDIE